MADAGQDTLAQLLRPLCVEEFLASTWGRAHLHLKGQTGRFASLLPWAQLNAILQQHRLDFPRLRLARDGQSLPASAYLRHFRNARRAGTIPRLLAQELTAQLRQGATLVLDAVDELYEPLTDLAAKLERCFHEHVQINAYAGWRTSRGFDLHWDDHDVFILQVAGRKEWRIYGETRPAPLVNDVEPAPKPTDAPRWTGLLADGDLLYIPRGWWHVALPLDEPTLHLTVGIHNRTGLDLLRWLVERMRSSELVRRDLPRFAGQAQQTAHAAALRAELSAALSDEVISRYFAEQDAEALPRPRLDLPLSAAHDAPPLADATRVRLTAPRPLDFKTDAGIVEFACHKKRWRFAADALLVLRPLAAGRACTVADLCAAAAGRLDAQTVRLFIAELIEHGLLALEAS
ncbi:MAG TPA: cupin domain-containing protein [Pyrinomonadaceae bacterium]|nr:cupin domain-containing protein [Pyrinomonadaceae bacterium]